MTTLRHLWLAIVELFTGRLRYRVAELEATLRDLVAEHNNLQRWTKSKLDAAAKQTSSVQTQVFALAARLPEREQVAVYRGVGDGDDEKTIALTDADIVMPKGRRPRD